ncbi:MAG: DcaP family trimeric outer membrane transporter [Rubripirellula sp.]
MPPIRFCLLLFACLAIRTGRGEFTMPNQEASDPTDTAGSVNQTDSANTLVSPVASSEPVSLQPIRRLANREQSQAEPAAGFLMPAVVTRSRSVGERSSDGRADPYENPETETSITDASERDTVSISQTSFAERLHQLESDAAQANSVLPVNFQLPVDAGSAEMLAIDSQYPMGDSASAFQQSTIGAARDFDIGVDFYSAPDFRDGLIIFGRNVAMKVGGYVKADFIYDADPIDSTDSFDTTTIPVNAEPRTNSRFHARQTRLSFDTRWRASDDIVRVFVEGDFFSEDNSFRLRHAYGEYGALLVGKTWTTFTDVAAAPATLDFEGSVSSINRRQAQARYSFAIIGDSLTGAVSVEDTRFIIEVPETIIGESRSPSPDFVARLRWTLDWAQFQGAYLYREVGFQPIRSKVITKSAGGFNFTGAMLLTDKTKAYSQILFGEGIGSYRLLPDAAPTSPSSAGLLGLFGWMIGVTHDWNDLLSSNFTYAQNSLDTVAFQDANDVEKTTYMAVNLLAQPLDRVTVGIEYLYGTREDVDNESASANRVQAAFIFELP